MSNYGDMFGSTNGVKAGTLNVIHADTDISLSQINKYSMIAVESFKDDSKMTAFGSSTSKEIASLSDKILKETTASRMGDFGKGMTEILALTSSVDPSDLNIDERSGLIGKIQNFIGKSKVKVMARFDDTSAHIEKIVKDLDDKRKTMVEHNKFLDELYDKNLVEHRELGEMVEAGKQVHSQMSVQYEAMKQQAETSQDPMEIQQVREFEQRIKRWEMKIESLTKMQHIALLAAPEIRMQQHQNNLLQQKFDDIITTTLPAWKKQLSLVVLALAQKKNVEVVNQIDDKTNEFFKKAAELNHDNSIAVAKASQRSVIDTATLEFMQSKLIDSVKQVKQIEEDGRKQRAEAIAAVSKMNEEMKKEMLSWNK